MLNLIKTSVQFLAQGAGSVRNAPAAPAESRSSTLRKKGIIGFIALVVYVAAAGVLIARQREASLQIIEKLERVHVTEDALTRTNTTLAHAVLEVNEAYFDTQTAPYFEAIVVNVEAVQAGLRPVLPEFALLTPALARIDHALAALGAAPERPLLLALRDGLHNLVSELDRVTAGVREQRRKLSEGYRTVHDAMTVTAIAMGLTGLVLFGGLTALFFSRLARDLNALERRARQVVRGYRGEPLTVTRSDEVGGLMRAVNQMQRDLRSRERQLEMVRQQRFHQEKMAAVGSLAAAIAHEINNPIAAIAGAAQQMCGAEHQGPCCEQGAPALILEQAQRIARITRQVSDLAAPQSAQAQWMDVNDLLRRTCHFVSYDQRLRGVEMNLDLDSQLPAFYGVPDELSQIVMNLLLNAADAVCAVAGRRPRVGVSSRSDGDVMMLNVSDNGGGMSEAACARVFEEGYTTKPNGSGMGLFICKSLIEARGGTIEITSAPAAGSTVRVRLPRQTEPAAQAEGA